MDSEAAANYLRNVVREGEIRTLKSLVREIERDFENPCEYLQRHCRNVSELEEYLKDHTYLFVVENSKVARFTDDLTSGRGNADMFFQEKLKEYGKPVKIVEFGKHVDDAPSDIRSFMEAFYPEKEFKRFLQRRPHLFATFKDGTVHLIESESVDYFKKVVRMTGEGMRYTSLRGHVGQAPDHIRVYMNNHYPDTEFQYFLEKNSHAFVMSGKGEVYLKR